MRSLATLKSHRSMGLPQSQFIARLGLSVPVVQGPFGGGLSSVELVAGVSDRGGLGSFGAHQVLADEIGPLAAQIRTRTRGPFALNLWIPGAPVEAQLPDAAALDRGWHVFEPYFRELGLERPAPPTRLLPDFDAQIEALLEARPTVFSFVFGVPTPRILEACRQRGIFTLGAATSIAEAQALADAGVDAIIASGMEAGGFWRAPRMA